MHVCTIVSSGSLARARVMAGTLREHHPDASLTVLLLDGDVDELDGLPNARLLGAGSLVGDGFGLLAAGNPAGALSMAVLPYLMRASIDSGERSTLFIDSGQRLLAPLSELLELLDAHEVVLVARASGDPAAVAMAAGPQPGVFSRQFLGLRAGRSAEALLAAWPRYFASAADDGARAVAAWIDSVPALAEDVGVLRGPRYGLDPWSLASLSLGCSADSSIARSRDADDGSTSDRVLEVDGGPARALDFSQLDPGDPPSWFDGPGRVRLSSTPALAELVERQARDLRAAGLSAAGQARNPYLQLEDGLRLSDTVRSLIVRGAMDGELRLSPFSDAGRRELYRYLGQPGGRGRGVGLTRLHIAIWEGRSDLREGYRHLDGPDGPGFAGWLCAYGREQEGLVTELLPPAPDLAYRDADPHIHEGEPLWGVNVVGFLTAELGVGEAARLLIAGLDAQGVPALPVQGRLMPPSRQGVDFSYARPDQAPYPINIMCINGDGIPVFAREAGRSFFEGRYTVALWWWEVGAPPASWTAAYEFVDEVWVASQYIYDSIAPDSPVPVVRIRLPVLAPEPAARTRSQLGLPQDGFLFLCVYDYHSVAARKNPLGVIDAFRRAFPTGAGAKLVLKSINAETHPEQHARVELAASAHQDITLLDRYVSGAEKNAMIAAGDCYVSLHRSEGFGIVLAEAMLLGKPVIATRYGGALEFMGETNSYLVDWRPVEVGDGAYPYAAESVWAEPDLDHAAALMRGVFEAPAQALERGAAARRDVLERHAPAVAGAVIEHRLTVIHERLHETGARSLNLAHLQPLSRHDELRGLIGDPPVPEPGRGVVGRVKARAHRPIAEWARAYVKHQRTIDDETQLAIKRIDDRVRELGSALQDQQKAQHAETLAVLRQLEADLADLRSRNGASDGS